MQNPREHRATIGAQAHQFHAIDMPGLEHFAAQFGQPIDSDALFVEAVLLEQIAQRPRTAAGAKGFAPVARMKVVGDVLDLGAGGELGGFQRGFGDAAVGKKPLRKIHAAHVQAFGLQGFQIFADNQFGRAATDIDYQPRVAGVGQAVRNA